MLKDSKNTHIVYHVNVKRACVHTESKPTKHNMRWTDDECQQLLQAHTRGISIKTMAQYHQRTEVAIKMKLHRLQKDHGNHARAYHAWTYAEDQKVLQAISVGKTIQEISQVLGRSASAISQELKKIAKKMHNSGDSANTIKAMTGLSDRVVQTIVQN